jgi:hypothetical protein
LLKKTKKIEKEKKNKKKAKEKYPSINAFSIKKIFEIIKKKMGV